jgi:hypothetical protein
LTDFLAKALTLDADRRAVVLFGRNVASYKFGLVKTLLALWTGLMTASRLRSLPLPSPGTCASTCG